MTIPANPTLEAVPYGAQPVVLVVGAQGGPYNVVDATHGIPVTLVGGGGGATAVAGDTAAGVADSGNPVKTGGKANTNPTAVSAGQRVDLWLGLSGETVTTPRATNNDVDGCADNMRMTLDMSGSRMVVPTQSLLWNGASRDRQRGNLEATLLASAARTATVQSADQTNYNGKRLLLIVDVSLVGTGSITPSLQVKDPVSGNYATVWTAAAAVVTGGTFTYHFEGGASGGSFTEKLAFGLPSRTWRIQITHNNANTITYSASANVGV